jgi:hypothetical protein
MGAPEGMIMAHSTKVTAGVPLTAQFSGKVSSVHSHIGCEALASLTQCHVGSQDYFRGLGLFGSTTTARKATA